MPKPRKPKIWCIVSPCPGPVNRIDAHATAVNLSALPLTAPLPQPGERAYWQKGILKLGVWNKHGWKTPLNATPESLAELVATFAKCKERGEPIPVIVSPAGAQSEHLDGAQTKVGEVESLSIAGDTLIARIWTASKSDPSVYELDVTNAQVSPCILQNYTDANGVCYPWYLYHVAIVSHPVVTGQDSFVRCLSKAKPQEVFNMAEEDEGAEGESAADDTTISVTDLVAMLREVGIPVPEDVDTATELKGFLKGYKSQGTTTEETPITESAPDDSLEAMGMPAEMAKTLSADQLSFVKGKLFELAKAKPELARAKAELIANQAAARQKAQQTFTLAVDSLVQRGQLLPAERDGIMEAGKMAAYEMAILKPFEALQSRVPTHSKARAGANAAAPNVAGETPTMTKERAKEIAKGAYARN